MKHLFLALAFSATAHAGEPDPSPAFLEPDTIACSSEEYRGFLRGLNEDLFRSAVNLCLLDIRQAAAKKAAVNSSVLPFKFHPVSAAELPSACPTGELEGLKTASATSSRAAERPRPSG